jgi:ATP-dependent phosphofructokinase / diphosphate-dependent phosphofructokinase
VFVFYWVVKYTLGVALKLTFRPWSRGRKNVPRRGPVILVSNHLSFADHFFGPLPLPRKVVFLAKSEYFTGKGVRGLLSKAFFSGAGQIPIDRTGGDASDRALRSGLRVLAEGNVLGIYPEGTRSPDGRLYKGKTGVARLALESRAPVVPCAMISTFEFLPPGTFHPQLKVRPGVIFGPPMEFSRFYGKETDRAALRAVTDEIIAEIAKLSGQEYVPIYAQEAKAQLQADKAAKAAKAGSSGAQELPEEELLVSRPANVVRSFLARVLGTARLCPMRVGVLTGGGDCPGLNAVIRAIVRRGIQEYGLEFVGFRDGWRGPLEADTVPLDVPAVRGILPRGGTILGSSRTNPFKDSGPGRSGVERIKDNLSGLGVDALIVIGGEDTLGVAGRLNGEGIPVVGVPKTIDNDLGATDYTFGFDTAVNIAMEAIDRLHTTAESHHRALIVEVMGRHAGWIALHAGLAGGANVILIPERPFDIEKVCGYVEHRFQTRYAPIVVVAEGAHPISDELSLTSGELDEFGHVRLGGVGNFLAREIEKRTGKEARCTVLGHVQRGGTPTAFDRVLATRFGLRAVQAVYEEAFGTMVALRGTRIELVPIVEATRELKLVPPERYAEAEVFFG